MAADRVDEGDALRHFAARRPADAPTITRADAPARARADIPSGAVVRPAGTGREAELERRELEAFQRHVNAFLVTPEGTEEIKDYPEKRDD